MHKYFSKQQQLNKCVTYIGEVLYMEWTQRDIFGCMFVNTTTIVVYRDGFSCSYCSAFRFSISNRFPRFGTNRTDATQSKDLYYIIFIQCFVESEKVMRNNCNVCTTVAIYYIHKMCVRTAQCGTMQ